MAILNTEISLFKPTWNSSKKCWIHGTTPLTVELGWALGFNHQPELLTEIRTSKDNTQLKTLKAGLWMITPSALMDGGRQSQHIAQHSGLLQFDIDHIDGKVTEYFDFIKQIPYVAYLGVSASGNGLWGLMRIAYPEKHAQHFDAMAKAFDDIGIKVDKAPRAVNSVRYLSYDGGHYYNPDATVFDKVIEPVKQAKKPLKRDVSNSDNNSDAKELIEWFNENCTAEDMDEILTNFGFNYHSMKVKKHRYTRPGKDTRAGLSVDYDEDLRTLFSFSENVPMLEKWKREDGGWSCSPLTALLIYGCGGYGKEHWHTAFEYIKSKRS